MNITLPSGNLESFWRNILNYHIIVKFDKQYGNSPRYVLTLVTQIKGVEFYGKKSQSKLRLYPNPKN